MSIIETSILNSLVWYLWLNSCLIMRNVRKLLDWHTNRQIVDRAGIFKIQSVHVLPNTLKPTTLYSMPILFLESPVVRSPILLVNPTVLEI